MAERISDHSCSMVKGKITQLPRSSVTRVGVWAPQLIVTPKTDELSRLLQRTDPRMILSKYISDTTRHNPAAQNTTLHRPPPLPPKRIQQGRTVSEKAAWYGRSCPQDPKAERNSRTQTAWYIHSSSYIVEREKTCQRCASDVFRYKKKNLSLSRF